MLSHHLSKDHERFVNVDAFSKALAWGPGLRGSLWSCKVNKVQVWNIDHAAEIFTFNVRRLNDDAKNGMRPVKRQKNLLNILSLPNLNFVRILDAFVKLNIF